MPRGRFALSRLELEQRQRRPLGVLLGTVSAGGGSKVN